MVLTNALATTKSGQGPDTGRDKLASGTHNHVRECDANLTSNGSYYATATQIKEAQRRYRVKMLKRFLRSQECVSGSIQPNHTDQFRN